jgi:peptidoglycan/LPS O-acetylase OafA/YrhL
MSSRYPFVPDPVRSALVALPPETVDESSDLRGGLDGAATAAVASLAAETPRKRRVEAAPLPPKPANTRYSSLDLWRGAACVMLLFYHATFYGDYHFRIGDPSTWTWAGLPLYVIRHCWFGVPIFFVISGYCIAASVDSLRRRPHSLRDYFVRRVRRVYPPLWIMCGIAVLYIAIMTRLPLVRSQCGQLYDLSTLTVWQWLGNFLAAESWRHHLGGGESLYLMANTWTLCYEEQFYFVTGVLLAVASRRFFQAAAWLTAAVILSRHVLSWMGLSNEGFFWDGHWVMFAAGILVYHSLNYGQPSRGKTVAVFAVGMVYGAAERLLGDGHFQKHLGEYLCVACAFAMALLYLRKWDEPVARHWLSAPLRWLGQRSYSIYLTHYLLVVVVSSLLAFGGLRSEWQVAAIVVPVCLLLSLPVAVLFYELVERRFINSPLSNR